MPEHCLKKRWVQIPSLMRYLNRLRIGACLFAVFLSSRLQSEILYDNTTDPLNLGYGPGVEFGDEIILNGTGGATITNLIFEYYGLNLSGGEQVRLRLYLNDGTQATVGAQRPGTVLYDSGLTPIVATSGATLDYSMNVAVPNSFTWAVTFTGLTAGESAGLSLYSPPAVGNSYTDYWEKTDTGWELKKNVSGVPMNFGARLQGTTSSTGPQINAPPLIDGPLSLTLPEDTQSNITGLNVSDPDAGLNPMAFSLSVTNGKLSFGSTAGLFAFSGNGAGTITFTANQDAANLALQGLTYLGNTNFSGNDTLTLTVNDQGNTGIGGPRSATVAIPMTVTPVLPVFLPVPNQTIAPNETNLVAITVSDVGTPPNSLILGATSSNSDLVSSVDILFLGTGSNRTVQIVPNRNQVGTALIILTARDNDGEIGTTSFSLVVVATNPVITTQPSPRIIFAGSDARFTVTVAGTPPIFYQWLFNGVPLTKETNAFLSLTNAQASSQGLYRVAVSNSFGTNISDEASLTIESAPTITAQPQSAVAVQGSNVDFRVVATGSAPLFYQWFADAIPLSSETNFTLTVRASPSVDGALYSVDVFNAVGRVSSAAVKLDVIETPGIPNAGQPQSATVDQGKSTQFTVNPSGTPPLFYQWKFDGVNLPGETNQQLLISNAQLTNAGSYSVVVTNRAGNVTSAAARLSVTEQASIVTQPQGFLLRQGESGTLTVTARGAPPLRYQWYQDGKLLPGATNSTLSLTNADPTLTGAYTVDADNSVRRRARSQDAVVKVFVPPSITRQPASQTIIADSGQQKQVFLAVTVSGTDPVAYRWQKDGVDIAGALTNEYRILSASPATNAGNYRLIATNYAGAVTSAVAVVTVNVPISITQQPVSRTIASGVRTTFAVSVAASTTLPLSYQWRFETNTIPWGTNSALVITNAQSTNSGSYSVAILNPAGTMLSSNALLSVVEPVNIIQQPQSAIQQQGKDVSFVVGATGDGPLSYQWMLDGVNIPNATNAILIVANVQPRAGTAAAYTVSVANAVSSQISLVATLTVLSVPAVSKLPSLPPINLGSNITLTVTVQGPGPFAYQWRLNGANISGATNSTYSFTLAVTNAGTYTVAVSGAGGTTTSEPTTIIANIPDIGFADNFANAVTVTGLTATYQGSNTLATAEVGEPAHSPGHPAQASVWLSWLAPGTGVATFNTVGSSFDTTLAIYTGASLGALNRVDYDEDGGPFLTSIIKPFNVTAGTLYRIAIDGFNGATGNIILSWSLQITPQQAPEITIQPIGQTAFKGTPVTFSVTAVIPNNTAPAYQWFLDGSSIPNATLSTYTIPAISINDVGAYVVRVSNPAQPALFAESKPVGLEMTIIKTGTEGPGTSGEDKPDVGTLQGTSVGIHSSAHALSSVARGFSGAQVFSSKTAVKQLGEPNHCGVAGGASTWVVYEAPTNGVLRLTTEGSTFATVLAVYTATNPDDFQTFVSVACDHGSGGDPKDSVVEFPVSTGTLYLIVVDGVNGARGAFQLNYLLAQPPLILQQPAFQTQSLEYHESSIVSTQSVVLGGTIKLSVSATNRIVATGAPNLSFQWNLNDGALLGATNATLILSNAGTRLAGDYSVTVSNFAGTTDSESIRLLVLTPPAILNPPFSQQVNDGAPASFTVTASGSAPLRYQWKFNNTIIPSATNATFSIPSVQSTDAGTYHVDAANAAGSAGSDVLLVVNEPPAIMTQPQAQTVLNGGGALFNVAATSTLPAGYQWRLNGVNIPGATNTTLSLTNVQIADGGDYSVVVSNLVRSVISASASLTVNVQIGFQQQPQDQSVFQGENAVFSVTAFGTAPLRYIWRFNGIQIPGATNAILQVTNVQSASLGKYQALVINAAGSASSRSAVLSLVSAPTIVTQPTNQTAIAGTNVTFSVMASGAGAIRYQWRLNDASIAGATNATLTVTNINETSGGDYQVLVANDAGAILSALATLTVNIPVAISTPPQSQSAFPGNVVLFTVTAGGTQPFHYQWQFSGTNILNATNATLTLTNIQISASGNYRVAISNSFSSAVSSAAALTVGAQQPIEIRAVQVLVNRAFHLTLSGPMGQDFALQTSTNLVDWSNFGTLRFTNQTLEVTDTAATNFTRRFYRTVR